MRYVVGVIGSVFPFLFLLLYFGLHMGPPFLYFSAMFIMRIGSAPALQIITLSTLRYEHLRLVRWLTSPILGLLNVRKFPGPTLLNAPPCSVPFLPVLPFYQWLNASLSDPTLRTLPSLFSAPCRTSTNVP